MPKGGVVLPTTAAPGSWLMAQYFATGDPGWIVPIQSLERGPPSFNLQAFKRFGVGYPDQELVSAIVGRCVDPKDSARHKEGKKVLFSAAHGSGLDAWRFVTKANDEEKQKQHLFGFPISVSPPVFPAMYSPTGAVFKKNRAGEIDLDVRRPTSDFSWPAPGHWMEHVVSSVNSSVDLDGDFPYVQWMAFHDFMNQVVMLKQWGEPVV